MSRETIIFVHIPKSGGTTFRTVLKRNYRGHFYEIDDISPQTVQNSVDRLRAFPDDEKRNVQCVMGHMPYGIGHFLPQPTRSITILREPVERVLSQIDHMKRGARDWNESDPRNWGQEDFAGKGTIEAYLDWMGEYGHHNFQTRLLVEPTVAEWDCLAKPHPSVDESALEIAKQTLVKNFAAVGLIERFDESLVLFKETLGWKNIFYKKTNVAKKRKPRVEYPEASLALIREHNQLDLELWRFAGELLDQAIAARGPGFAERVAAFQKKNSLYVDAMNLIDPIREKVQLRTRLKRLVGAR